MDAYLGEALNDVTDAGRRFEVSKSGGHRPAVCKESCGELWRGLGPPWEFLVGAWRGLGGPGEALGSLLGKTWGSFGEACRFLGRSRGLWGDLGGDWRGLWDS